MSRHRHVRNQTYDDYMDDYDDDYYEEEDVPDEEANQYLWRGDDNTQSQSIPDQADAEHNELMEDLTKQFRTVLGDNTISAEEIDAAIVATDYDVEAAMLLLKTQLAEQRQSSNIEMTVPQSAIGKLIANEEEDSSPQPPEIAATPFQVEYNLSQAYEHYSNPEATVAVFKSDMTTTPPVDRFNFDTPSPDDLVLAKRAQADNRARTFGRQSRDKKVPEVPAKPVASSSDSSAAASHPNGRVNQQHNPKPSGDSLSLKGKGIGSKAANRRVRNMLRQEPGFASQSKRTQVDEPEKSVEGNDSNGTNQIQTPVVKQRAKKINLNAKTKSTSTSVSIVVAGHVDAGKSTLLGHLLQKAKGTNPAGPSKRNKRAHVHDMAWETDEDQVERERGVTIDIATRIFTTSGSNPRTYAMIDAPGHRDFVPAMILGAAQASSAILVVDSSVGEFEAGFSEDGQTREHALVLKSLGVNRLIVVINKMDVVDYSEERYSELKSMLTKYLSSNGWKVARSVSFVAASGREGTNLLSKPDASHPLMKWYTGDSLFEAMEKLPSTEQSIIKDVSEKPTRLVASDFFRSASLGGDGAVTGRLLCGSIAPKDNLLLCPGGTIVTVKSVIVGSGEKTPIAVAGADALPVSIGLVEFSAGNMIYSGNVLCDPQAPVPVVSKFQAQILTTAVRAPLIQGSRVELHVGGGCEIANISKLIELVSGRSSKAKGEKKQRPRRLTKGDSALVEISCQRDICIEKASDVKSLGRFTLRKHGQTVAVGVVTGV